MILETPSAIRVCDVQRSQSVERVDADLQDEIILSRPIL